MVQHMLHQIKASQFYCVLVSKDSVPVNGRIQGLFKVFECFSSTFRGKMLFSRVFQDSPVYSSTFHAYANPVNGKYA